VNPATGSYYPNNTVPVDNNAKDLLALLPLPNLPNNYLQCLARSAHALARGAGPHRSELQRQAAHVLPLHSRFVDQIEPTPEWGNGASFPTVQTNFVGPGVSWWPISRPMSRPLAERIHVQLYHGSHFPECHRSGCAPVRLYMTGLYNNGFGGLMPAVGVAGGINYDTSGFSLDTGYFPWNNANPTYTYKDQLTKIIGGHNLYFGAYVVAAEKNEENSPYIQGILGFDNTDTAISTGNAFADMLDRPDCEFLSSQSQRPSTTTGTKSWSRISRTIGMSPRGSL
jgi:hypothetical protein